MQVLYFTSLLYCFVNTVGLLIARVFIIVENVYIMRITILQSLP